MTQVHAVQDAREVITPESFAIAPELLGLPLARPWRRAAAMLADLTVCGTLVALIGAPGVFLGSAGAVLLFRLKPRKPGASFWRRAVRGMVRSTGALVIFVACIATWQSITSREPRAEGGDDDGGGDAALSAGGDVAAQMSLAGLGVTLTDVATLFGASSDADARLAADRITASLIRDGLDAEDADELKSALDRAEAEGLPFSPVALEALRRALTEVAAGGPATADSLPPADSLALAYAAALTRGDSAATGALRPRLAGSLAAEELAALRLRGRRLERRVDRLEEENETLRDERDRAREGAGLFSMLWDTLQDLGLGIGWLMLYFTAFLALWRGRTPGKQLLRLRVIRLDGKPIGWWAAFERFGGYAAAISTGLLGFFQILWDRNRQGVQDRIAGTVVIRE